MHKHISSLQNTIIKKITLLSEKSRERKRQKQFVVEGKREILLAKEAKLIASNIVYCKSLVDTNFLQKITRDVSVSNCISVSDEVYQKIAYRGTTEGIIAIFEANETSLQELSFENKNPLILVAEAPEKPGNIGALLRTADAANLDAVIIANPKTDLYNPNIIRSSVGCVFTNKIVMASTLEIISFLKQKEIAIYCAALQASKNYTHCNFEKGTAIVVGTEAHGLSQDWLKHSTENIIIPMQGAIDSMNVSVAAGILIFEAKRQRNFL